MKQLSKIQMWFSMMLLFSLVSCLSETEDRNIEDKGYDYFPVEIGKEWTYQSDSVIITKFGQAKDTLKSLIREVISDTLRNENGHLVYVVERFLKKDGQEYWEKMNSWTIEKDNSKLLRTEENIPLVKFVFPFKQGTRFKSNLYFDDKVLSEVGNEFLAVYDGWWPKVERLDEDVFYKNDVYPAVRINVANYETIIDLRQVTEYYVKGIGLVKKDMAIYNANADNIDRPWSEKANKGFSHTLQLIDHK